MVTADFAPSRPVSILHIHSLDDPRVPYHGGYGEYLWILQSIERLINPDLGNPDVEQMLARWRKFDKCPEQPRIGPTVIGQPGSPDYGNTATKYTWGPCAQGTEVVLWKLAGSQHVWPGGAGEECSAAQYGPVQRQRGDVEVLQEVRAPTPLMRRPALRPAVG